MLSKKQISLKAWIKQRWRTKSGKKSSLTGERYLPEKAIKALSEKEYKLTSKLKRKTIKKYSSGLVLLLFYYCSRPRLVAQWISAPFRLYKDARGGGGS